MNPFRLDRTLWPAVAALGGIFVLFEASDLDLQVQDLFFDFSRGAWLIDRDEPALRALFYDGPKAIIILLGISIVGLAVRPPIPVARRDLLVAFLCLASVPLIVGGGKSVTNVFCPWDDTRYGGDVPYVKIFERFPPGQRPPRRGHGFPAGHASGGFALFGLAGLARARRGQHGSRSAPSGEVAEPGKADGDCRVCPGY